MDVRSALNKDISIEDFRDFYWLKAELIEFCRQEGLSRQGGKIQIADRIAAYLQTGEKEALGHNKKPVRTSKFDWNNEKLTPATIITDSYKNSENVRAFFREQIGAKFKFNVRFMSWMKQNSGKTLADAVDAWQQIELEKGSGQRKEIAPQFEYNRYIRDFLEDNPEKTREDAIQCWNVKRLMRGSKAYKKSDLSLIADSGVNLG